MIEMNLHPSPMKHLRYEKLCKEFSVIREKGWSEDTRML